MEQNGINSVKMKMKTVMLTLRRNSYRVLLTRGRDGFIVFVPPVEKLNSVYDLLLSVGIKEL